MKDKKEGFFIFFVFVLAFSFRCVYLIFLKKNYFFFETPSDDVLYYQQWANAIAQGHATKSQAVHGMPLYPYFLAILQRLASGHIDFIRITHLLIGSINCVFAYFLAKRIFFKKIAVFASLLMAVNFVLIYYDCLMVPVPILIFLSFLTAFIALDLDMDSSRNRWFLLGVMLGISSLGDGKFLIFSALLSVYLMCTCRKSLLKFIANKLVFLLFGIFVVLSAFTLQNRIATGDWVFISAQSGFSFYVGNNPNANGIFSNPFFIRSHHQGQDEDQKVIAEINLNQRLKASEVSRFWKHKAFSFIRNSPRLYLNLLKNKLIAFLTENEYAHDLDLLLQKRWKDAFDFNSFRWICPLAILGMILTFKTNPQARVISFIIISQLILTLMFFMTTRHRASILPFLIIYEAYVLTWLTEQKGKQNKAKLITGVAVFFALFLILKPVRVELQIIEFLNYAKAGPIFAKHDNYAKAQEQYQNALTLQPFDTSTLYNLANLFVVQKNFSSAIAYYQKALAVNPQDVDVLYNLAYAYEQSRQIPSAIAIYQNVINLTPDSFDAHFRLASIYQNQNNCVKAVIHYKQCMEMAPHLREEINQRIERCR